MATRSTITVRTGENERKKIYCHWDGGLDHNGRILKEFYNTQEKAEALIALGDLSSLGEMIAPPEGAEHSFKNRYPGVCVAYGRDRGEKDTEARVLANGQTGNREEYNYLFVNGEWTLDGRSF
jgi:hypothetical protein